MAEATAMCSSDTATCDVTLYVACYNEEKNITATLDTISEAATAVGCSYEIIVIDDASQDRSVEVVSEYIRHHPERPLVLMVNDCNQGIGHNFVEAALYGKGRYFRMVCGDNVESYANFVKLFTKMGSADIILSYPINPEVRPWSRRLVSQIYVWLVNLLSGHRIRYYNNLPIFIRTQVVRWHPNTHGFGFQADLVTQLIDMGATYVEVPTVARERTAGKSNAFRLRNVCSVAHSLLEIFIRRVAQGLFPNLSRDLHRNPQTITAADLAKQGSAATRVPVRSAHS